MDRPDSTRTRRIIGLAMRVHTRLGLGLLESAYEHCRCRELNIHTLPYTRRVDLPLEYDGTHLDCGYRADLIVDHRVVLALKSVPQLLPLHDAQLLICLRLSQCCVGRLLNFNTLALKDGFRRRVL